MKDTGKTALNPNWPTQKAASSDIRDDERERAFEKNWMPTEKFSTKNREPKWRISFLKMFQYFLDVQIQSTERYSFVLFLWRILTIALINLASLSHTGFFFSASRLIENVFANWVFIRIHICIPIEFMNCQKRIYCEYSRSILC